MWVSVCRNTVRERVRQNRRNELLADIFHNSASAFKARVNSAVHFRLRRRIQQLCGRIDVPRQRKRNNVDVAAYFAKAYFLYVHFARRRLQLPVRNLAYGNGSANHSLSVLSEILYRRHFFRRRQGITEILFIGKGKKVLDDFAKAEKFIANTKIYSIITLHYSATATNLCSCAPILKNLNRRETLIKK